MYAGTWFWSNAGLPYIYGAKSFIYWYLLIDAGIRLIELDKHPDDEKYIWTISNWIMFSLRRVIIEIALVYIYPVTQFVPFLNWILNLLPIAISYVNVFIL